MNALIQREQFAVGLRKQKRNQVLYSKRLKKKERPSINVNKEWLASCTRGAFVSSRYERNTLVFTKSKAYQMLNFEYNILQKNQGVG